MKTKSLTPTPAPDPSKRTYRGTVQAEVAELTRKRIIEAMLDLSEKSWMDQITLQDIAERAGVTVQTILRHYASKEGLVLAVSYSVGSVVVSERDAVEVGNVEGATEYLVGHYESMGDRVLHLLAQEKRYPPLGELMESGRKIHREWVGRVFAPYMATKRERERLIPQLTAVCDVYIWKLLRRDMGKTAEEYRTALQDLIWAIIKYKRSQP